MAAGIRGLLIIISGPSGVGKGTVRQEIMKDDSLNLAYSISMTTRTKREHEVEGSDYYFVTREEFEKNIASGNLLEYAEFAHNFYGTPKDKVEEMRDQGKNVILEIEVNGTQQVLGQMHGPDVVPIFLIPPSLEELERRLRGRATETEDSIRARLRRAKSELELRSQYEFVVLNDDPVRAAEEIKSIIRNKITSLAHV